MAKVIIEIDGVKHKLTPNDPEHIGEYCTPENCSLYRNCYLSRDCLCCIHDAGSAVVNHYELIKE